MVVEIHLHSIQNENYTEHSFNQDYETQKVMVKR